MAHLKVKMSERDRRIAGVFGIITYCAGIVLSATHYLLGHGYWALRGMGTLIGAGMILAAIAVIISPRAINGRR